MNLFLVDDAGDILEIISKNVKDRKIKIQSLSNWRDLDLSKYSGIYLFAYIQNNFVDFTVQEFILENKINININIIPISKTQRKNEIFIAWVNALKFDLKLELKICTKVLISNLASDLELIVNIANNKIKHETVKNNVVIYTDGACSGNPGPGGWGIILMTNKKKKEISGFEPLTTNNKMELTAVVKALSMLKQKCNVELYSDSAYVVNAINQNWIQNWRRNGWKNSDREQVKNIELWHELDELINYHNVNFIKVRGHADNEFNNRCDELATLEIAKNKIED